MPIEINNLHIRSNVVQRAPDAAAPAAPAPSAGGCGGTISPAERERLLAECRRMIRDALLQQRER